MDLIGVLSNHDLQATLRRLVKRLAAVRAGTTEREHRSGRLRPRRPGWVLNAVADVLTERDRPMRARDIHCAVEALVGQPVASSSIKGALASNVQGSSPRFVRVARGRYVLASAYRLCV